MPHQTIFITGASSGFGRALALELAKKGAHVAIAARRQDLLEELAHEIRAQGSGAATVVAVDVRIRLPRTKRFTKWNAIAARSTW